MTIDLSGGIDVQREYVYAQCPEIAQTRDAVNVWLENNDAKFGMRIGIEALAPKWDTHEFWLDIAFADGRVISGRDFGKTHPAIGPEGLATIRAAGPLQFRCVEPFRTWTTSFKDRVAQITAEDLINLSIPDAPALMDVEFDIEMTMVALPFVPGSLTAEGGKALNSSIQGDYMSPRYEQLFRARGALRVGNEHFDVNANGLRIRRQGVRKFEGFWGHCWQSAVFPSGRAFGYCAYPPRADGEPSYNEGFIIDHDGIRKPARAVQIPWLNRLVTKGDDVSFVLETAAGPVSIQGETFVNTRSRGSAVLPADFPIVQQAHARYRWGNEETVGMVERSSPPSKMTL
jgi:hypothetical protein